MRAAHGVTQVRRVDIDRLQRIDGAERGREPSERGRRESALQQLRRLDRAHWPRWRAQHHRDQPLAVAGRGRDQVEAGGADEAGLHPVGARIAADQGVVVAVDPLAHADAGQVPVVVVFGKLADHGARENGEVARGHDLLVGGQAVGIDEVRLSHPQPLRRRVHLVGEILDRPGDALGEQHRHVVCRLHHQHLERVVDGDQGADRKSHLGRRLRSRRRRDRHGLVEGDAALLDRTQRHVGSHDLGD